MFSNWYAIHVQTGSEKIVCEKMIQLTERAFYHELFVPMAEYMTKKDAVYQTRIRPLFPGYLFLVTDRLGEIIPVFQRISDFKRIVRTGVDIMPIQQEEADLIAGICDEEHEVRMSTGIIQNSQILITNGPLKGREGLIRKIDRHHRTALVEMNLMGQPMQVSIPLEIVKKF